MRDHDGLTKPGINAILTTMGKNIQSDGKASLGEFIRANRDLVREYGFNLPPTKRRARRNADARSRS